MTKNNENGFTLMEMLIAASLSFVLILGILRLYSSSAKSYNLQDMITEMNQNASYTCKRLSDEIMQAGVYLPDAGYTIISMKSGKFDSISIRSNPSAAFQKFVIDINNAVRIPVDNGIVFSGVSDLLKLDADLAITNYTIKTSYSGGTFSKGVDTISTPNQIYLTSPASFVHGDILFASKRTTFFKSGTNFCMNTPDNVLAENIDSIAIVFYNKAKTPTLTWGSMVYASIYVRSRTSVQDLKYKHPVKGDHYRRYSQNMDVLIRKRTTF